MSATTRFTENETGVEVSVFTPFPWGNSPAVHTVKYPSGRVYAVSEELLNRHFSIITPQEVFLNAYGVDDRPTKKQTELDSVPPFPPTTPDTARATEEPG